METPIILKKGTKLDNLKPPMIIALIIMAAIYQNRKTQCTVTSGNDSKHRPDSLHYEGNALDFRTRHLTGTTLDFIAAEARAALGSDYDVVIEANHLHVEYDPPVHNPVHNPPL